MRKTALLKSFLGPLLAAGAASAAIAGSPRSALLDGGPLWPAAALLAMLALSAGTIAWTRRERRRSKRDDG